MGIYIIMAVILLFACLITIKVLSLPFNKKNLIIALIYAIGGAISISGEMGIITSIYVMALSLITMYGSMRAEVQKAWDNKELNDKIDNFTDKMVEKNKRLAKENERKTKEKNV